MSQSLKIIFNAIEGKFDFVTDDNQAFQRNLTKDLILEDGEALVTVGYINTGSHNIDLNGDADIYIL